MKKEEKMPEKEKPKVSANTVIEVMGKPPEHLNKTLEDIIEKMKKESYFEVKSQKINQPQEMENKKGYYTNFAEIEIEFQDITVVPQFVFKYMPAHIEIVSPENITMPNNDWNSVLNEITRKLHGYDEVTRTVQAEKQILEKKLKQLTGKETNTEKGQEEEEKEENQKK